MNNYAAHLLDQNDIEAYSEFLDLPHDVQVQQVVESSMRMNWANYTPPSKITRLTNVLLTMLNPTEQARVEEFMEVLSLSDVDIPKVVYALQNSEWDVNHAMNLFLSLS